LSSSHPLSLSPSPSPFSPLMQPLHEALIKRFLDALYVMMAPITPHFCEHMWGTVLGHQGSVVQSPWPVAGEPDSTLLQADDYLAAKLHEFRLAILKSCSVKPKAQARGVAPALAARPTHANICVATAWPEWQRKPLEQLAGLWDPAAHGTASGGFPDNVLTLVKDAATADAALRPHLKKIMPLASITCAAMKGRSTKTATLALALPFDEFAVWTENAEYVRKALELEPGGLRVLRTDDAVLQEAASAAALDPQGKFKAVVPMEPDIHPYVPAPASA
jgi:leucyl-tRNA synthetase